MQEKKNIVIIGAGSIGTALGHTLAAKEIYPVVLLTIEQDVAQSVNDLHVNQKYFPNIRLHPGLKATLGEYVMQDASLIFLAIPSIAVVDYLRNNRSVIGPSSVLINLAKGFGNYNMTIAENLQQEFPNPFCSMKGPAFARDMISGSPTAFTLATTEHSLHKQFDELFEGTSVYLDHTDDVTGVELLSILKNIYAIILGIVDAHYNSANFRFLFLSRAFNEMRHVLVHFGGKQETLFNYCGYGDFSLTALNDLSRNRTLGLLIGKGFFTEDISSKVVLEGRLAVNVFHDKLITSGMPVEQIPLIHQLYLVFNQGYPVQEMIRALLGKDLISLTSGY
jgi:glycerol-3-phosphate dehydrogenase (NAD(P)+)